MWLLVCWLYWYTVQLKQLRCPRNHILDGGPDYRSPKGKGRFFGDVQPVEKHCELLLQCMQQKKSITASVQLLQPTALLVIGQFICSFVCYCVQRPSLLRTSVLRPVRLPREWRGMGRCERCVLSACGEGKLSRSGQLVGYFYSTPLLNLAFYLAYP